MKIALIGDVALFGRFGAESNIDVENYLAAAKKYLDGHDIVVANLETPFVHTQRPYGAKSAHIKACPSTVDILKFLGVSHVTLGNNHIGDFGPKAYGLTTRVLDANEIAYCGIEGKGIRIDTEDAKVAVLGYCSYNTNPLILGDGYTRGVNVLDVERVLEDMSANTKDGYLNILAVHSGQEHVHMPSVSDIQFARGLAKRFDYVYYGHHPHVIQGVEELQGSVVFYSLGNFLFDDVYTPKDKVSPLITLSDANKTGLIASVEVNGSEIDNWSTIPVFLGDERMLIGDEVVDFTMDQYNEYLEIEKIEDYQTLRSKVIADFISGRISKRNLKWYLKRLNPNSVKMILNSKRNARLQNQIFEQKLDMLS